MGNKEHCEKNLDDEDFCVCVNDGESRPKTCLQEVCDRKVAAFTETCQSFEKKEEQMLEKKKHFKTMMLNKAINHLNTAHCEKNMDDEDFCVCVNDGESHLKTCLKEVCD